MVRSAWWVCLLLCSIVVAQDTGVQLTPIEGNKPAPAEPRWADAPVRLCCSAEPADRALRRLADELRIGVWVSQELESRLGQTRVTMQAESLSAEQAFRWLARLCDAQAVTCEQGVYVGPPVAGTVAWAMWCRADGPTAGAEEQPTVCDKRAPIDLHDATVTACVQTLSRAFGVNSIFLPGPGLPVDLVTIESPGMTLAEAQSALCRQTGLAVCWLDGSYVFGSPKELDALIGGPDPGPEDGADPGLPGDEAEARRLLAQERTRCGGRVGASAPESIIP